MRKTTTALIFAVSAIGLTGCEKKADVAAVAETTEAATAAASEGTDADAAASEEGDPNGNPIKP